VLDEYESEVGVVNSKKINGEEKVEILNGG
jgi:hypothetical protein